MLKKLSLLTIILLLGALSAAAQTPCKKGGDLSWLFAPEPTATLYSGEDLAWLLERKLAPAVNADPAAPSAVELASNRRRPNGIFKTVTCTEDCNELPDISCTGNTSCSAISRDCASGACVRGSVTCDGVTTQCSQVCPPNCTLFQCKQGCQQPGCVAVCLDRCTCECDTICQ